MIIGIPAEVKTAENRVAMTPDGVRGLTALGHTVRVQSAPVPARPSRTPTSWAPEPPW